MKILAAGTSHEGTTRPHNEDYMIVDPDLSLYVVCDGMGGHAAGEVAARLAAESVRRFVVERRETVAAFDESPAARSDLMRLVDDAMQFACREVFRTAKEQPECAGMATSMTMVLVAGDFGVMGHVGATRLYLQRGGRTDQLSEDHTYTAAVAKRGTMAAEDLNAGPWARVVTRAVGLQYGAKADVLLFDLLPGDTLLLCTSGVYHRPLGSLVPGAFLEDDDLDSIPRKLVTAAREGGSASDTTVIALRALSRSGDAGRDLDRASQVNLRIDTLRRIVLFRHLDMREVCKVLQIVRVERIDAETAIIREGENSNALYAVLTGTLRVERAGRLVRRLTAGDHFGEMALLNDRPRSASVVAQTPTDLLVMELSRFDELLRTDASLSVKLLWSFAQVLSFRLHDVTSALYDDQDDTITLLDASVPAPFRVRN